MRLFVETRGFTRWVGETWSDEDLAGLQRDLLDAPERGAVIPGCGGLCKLRVADPRRGQGKRGGARVIHLHVPEAGVFFLIHAYSKGESEDLSADQKRELAELAGEFRREAITWAKRPRRRG